jgi:signal transduction histidine kinase
VSKPPAAGRPAPPPGHALRVRLLKHADELARSGQEASARALRAMVEAWWAEEEAWMQRLVDVLRIHHEINNALVGVRGNAQLLLMAPVAEQPAVRERLEVIFRESTRIRDAAVRIGELKYSISGPGPSARAA